MGEPDRHDDPDALAAAVIERVGRTIRLALPLGLGKANHFVNALVRHAMAEPDLSLTIYTALTLEAPRPGSELERRFVGPFAERLFGGYPELLYAQAMREGTLPENIRVCEFFFVAGRWLGVPRAQQDYVSANYTHIFPLALDNEINLVAQLVAPPPATGQGFSLSCNPDITVDLLRARRDGRADFVMLGEVNDELPWMGGDAEAPAAEFDFLLDAESLRFPLFAPPREPVSLADHAIGLHVASLVPDGGTLQIGIGAIGDAVAAGLILRQRDPGAFADLLAALERSDPPWPRQTAAFAEGLYGCSEMLVPGFLDLLEAGILKREVDDGVLMHAGFFLGSRDFYRRLRAMSSSERAKIAMTAVSFVNELYGPEEPRKRAARRGARFVNSAMMVTLLGAVVSDGLEDGRVVSGVGGQYNFVAQAFALDGARSIIALPATRRSGGKTVSNIRWSYGHTTIPRHLRDIVVTEYGIADLRGRSDVDVIEALLAVTDSRFQHELIGAAQRAGKLPSGYRLPSRYRDNLPGRIERSLGPARREGRLTAFPFGSDFDAVEQLLLPALERLREASRGNQWRLVGLCLAGIGASSEAERACLARMDLDRPAGWRERAYRLLVTGALRRSTPLTSG